MGRPDRREDHPDHREGLHVRHPHDLPGGLRGRADHRPGGDVPRPPRRRQDLPHPGPRVRVHPAGVRAVRPLGRGRRLHPGVLRLRRDGQRERVDVPGQPPHGRDGGQGADHAGGDGRRADALHGLRLRALPGRIGAGRDNRGPQVPVLPARQLARRAARGRTPATRSRPTCAGWSRPASARPSTCAGTCAGIVDADSLFEIHALWARELVVGFARLDGQVDRRGREQPDVQGRRAVRRLGGQGHALHPAL